MKSVGFFGISAMAALLAVGHSPARGQQSATPATIIVNAASMLGPVNWLVFGDNIEAADSKHVFGDQTNLFPLHTGAGF